ncbi:MAG: hypothetical protein CSA38_03915 [Flavobacteriales bacterium]|nr:MAG: hypothetical protein CSA38_03915 [Flavobacteriales bacterium]
MQTQVKKIVMALILFVYGMMSAQPGGAPGGVGTSGPGARPQSSIDMYVWLLAIFAVAMVGYYAYQQYKRKAIS